MEASEARPSLHTSKCQIVGNLMPRLKFNDETIDGVINEFHYILNPPRSCQLVVHHLFIFVCIISSHALS